jgi:threonine dehydrogenase-like Zn-dependent dehydrogenase
MRATLLYAAGDVRVEEVPDSAVKLPTDALVRITASAICGSDLWPYASLKPEDGPARTGHEFIGVVEETGPEVTTLKRGDLVVSPFAISDVGRHPGRTSLGREFGATDVVSARGAEGIAEVRDLELMPDILDGTIEPGKVFDTSTTLDGVPAGYQDMADRNALKVLIRP